MSGSPSLFSGSSTLCLDPLSFSTALRHCVWIPYHFSGSSTLCLDPFSFGWLSSIMSKSSILSMALQHRARIPKSIGASPASCSDPLVFNHCDPSPLAFGIVVRRQNYWPLISSLKFISTHSSLALRACEPLVHSLY